MIQPHPEGQHHSKQHGAGAQPGSNAMRTTVVQPLHATPLVNNMQQMIAIATRPGWVELLQVSI